MWSSQNHYKFRDSTSSGLPVPLDNFLPICDVAFYFTEKNPNYQLNSLFFTYFRTYLYLLSFILKKNSFNANLFIYSDSIPFYFFGNLSQSCILSLLISGIYPLMILSPSSSLFIKKNSYYIHSMEYHSAIKMSCQTTKKEEL